MIQVRRDNQIVRQVDLYDYLLRGDKSGDIRLEQGDVIFVPIVLRQAIVTGNVKRPAVFAVPAFATRLVFGEMADELLLASQRAMPVKLLASGFSFRYSRLNESLRHVLRRR